MSQFSYNLFFLLFSISDHFRIVHTHSEHSQPSGGASGGGGDTPYKPPLILLPGFASSRLRSWSRVDCPNSVLQFEVGDGVWMNIAKVIGANSCWLECMTLDPITQADKKLCKIRADEGLDAISELEPGIVIGPMSRVWRTFIEEVVHRFGYTPFDLIAVPYDFRLSPSVLQKRDDYFDRLKLTIEAARKSWTKKNGDHAGGVVILAHSMGNNVFRYFTEWLKYEFDTSEAYQAWLDEHIASFVAVGAPFLGSPESVRAAVSGLTFGLPIAEMTAREMATSFSSTPWMFPFVDGVDTTKDHRPVPAKFPKDILEFRWADTKKKPKVYKASDVLNGNLFTDLSEYDPKAASTLEQVSRYYINDPILNPLTLWERPPVKRVFCIYGMGISTPARYTYTQSETSNDTWILTATEFGEGDGTVPYSSLAWCHSWLGEKVNITTIPQKTAYGEEEVEICYNADRHGNCESLKEASLTVAGDKSKMYEHRVVETYVDKNGVEKTRTRDTAVWEMDNMEHRKVIQSPEFLFELSSEFAYQLEKHLYDHGIDLQDRAYFDASHDSGFSNRLHRRPKTDDDCYWDYYAVGCHFPEYCEYRYIFGDIHLGQSCRKKQSLALDYTPSTHGDLSVVDDNQPNEANGEEGEIDEVISSKDIGQSMSDTLYGDTDILSVDRRTPSVVISSDVTLGTTVSKEVEISKPFIEQIKEKTSPLKITSQETSEIKKEEPALPHPIGENDDKQAQEQMNENEVKPPKFDSELESDVETEKLEKRNDGEIHVVNFEGENV